MSRDNVELARRLMPPEGVDVAALKALGLDAVRAAYADVVHPDFEAEWPAMAGDQAIAWRPFQGPAKGIDAYFERYSEWVTAFDRWHMRPLDFIDIDDDRVLIRAELSVTTAHGGVETTVDTAGIWTFEDARLRRIEEYMNAADAYRAAGLEPPG
jgi:hypothetical protein